jgi:hypothetical protein
LFLHPCQQLGYTFDHCGEEGSLSPWTCGQIQSSKKHFRSAHKLQLISKIIENNWNTLFILMVESLHFLGSIETFRGGAQSGANWFTPCGWSLYTKLQKKNVQGPQFVCKSSGQKKKAVLSLKDELHIGTRFCLHNNENQDQVYHGQWELMEFLNRFSSNKKQPNYLWINFWGWNLASWWQKNKRGCQWYKGFILEKNGSMSPHYEEKWVHVATLWGKMSLCCHI